MSDQFDFDIFPSSGISKQSRNIELQFPGAAAFSAALGFRQPGAQVYATLIAPLANYEKIGKREVFQREF